MKRIGKNCVYCRIEFSDDFVYCPNCASVLKGNAADKTDDLWDVSYSVTLFEGRNTKTRAMLMVCAFVFVMGIAISALVSSIYYSDAFVAAIDDDLTRLSFLGNEIPMKIEELDRSKLQDEGGGGGSGKDHSEISKGELPPQFREKQLLTPSKDDISVTNPAIRVMRSTRGPTDIIRKRQTTTNGDPNSQNVLPSNGVSSDRLGMGEAGERGIGRRGHDGVGENGPGGIGRSQSDKDGIKAKRSDIEKEIEQPPKLRPNSNSGITNALNILAKPKAVYTNAAREEGIQGTVTLRVTFNANGTIGNIVAISGLPGGLTEQAIAAARNIKFEPVKKNGVAQTVSRQIAYTFILY